MKKLFLLLVLANALPIVTKAQDDDLYFVPSKVAQENSNDNKPAYYVGSDRKVDEYNRRGQFRSKYQMIGADSLGNDIISFGKGTGVYPDSSYVDTTFYYSGSPRMEDEDYAYTRYMSRWDGFYNPWFYRYWGPYRYGWYGAWYNSWYNPWYGAWYDPWFDPWFDPWYYGYGWGWNGWYSPWYYGYGWGYPYWGGWYGGGYVNHYAGGNPRGLAGNRTWSYGRPASDGNGGFGRTYSNSGNSGRSSTYTSRSAGNRSFGSRSRSSYPTSTYNNSGFGSSTRSSVGSSGSSGSFGGGRSSGGGFGGGHSSGGGGGSFGGGRR